MSCFISASTICAINSLRRCSASVESLASRSARAFTLVPSSQNRPCQHAARQCDALQAPRFLLRRPQNQTSSSSRNARSAGSSGASNGSSASTNAGVVGTACVGRSDIPASSSQGPEGGLPLRFARGKVDFREDFGRRQSLDWVESIAHCAIAGLGGWRARTLVRVLGQCLALTTLDLAQNGIDDDGMAMLRTIIPDSTLETCSLLND